MQSKQGLMQAFRVAGDASAGGGGAFGRVPPATRTKVQRHESEWRLSAIPNRSGYFGSIFPLVTPSVALAA